jgi:hypothetical protein
VSLQADPAGPTPERAASQAGAATQMGTVSNGATAAGSNGTAFNVVDLTLSFGQRAVLSNLLMDIGAGRVTALLPGIPRWPAATT